MRKVILVVLGLLVVAPSAFADSIYHLDPSHTTVGFSVKHMVISNVQGRFNTFNGHFMMDEKERLTHVKATVKVDSVNTENKKRDDHLRSPDFFDVKKFPDMTFTSTKVRRSGKNYTVKGDLTIKGVTRKLTLKGKLLGVIKDPRGKTRAGFHAEGKFNRKDFGINFNKLLDNGGLVVDNIVNISLDVEGIKMKPKKNPCDPSMKMQKNPCNPCSSLMKLKRSNPCNPWKG